MPTLRTDLPPSHLSIDQFHEIEKTLRSAINQPSVEIRLNHDGICVTYHSIKQIESEDIDQINGASGYSLRIAGRNREVEISGGCLPDESHVLRCRGPKDWGEEIQEELKEILEQESNSALQSARKALTDTGARRGTIASTFLVTITIGPLVPGLMTHITPTLLQAIQFWIAVSILLFIQFRDWVFPYIAVEGNRSPRKRTEEILLWAMLITVGLLIIKYITEPSVDLLAYEIFGTRYIIPG